MLSQARAISFEITPSALDGTLLEQDEIKRHRPPYNVALAIDDRKVWFTSQDLSTRSEHVSPRCPLGPFPSAGSCCGSSRSRRQSSIAGSSCASGTAKPWTPLPTDLSSDLEDSSPGHSL
jgi:excinuclease UvrABC nuclease subunit